MSKASVYSCSMNSHSKTFHRITRKILMAELFWKIKLHAEEAGNFSRKSAQPLVFDSIFVNYSVKQQIKWKESHPKELMTPITLISFSFFLKHVLFWNLRRLILQQMSFFLDNIWCIYGCDRKNMTTIFSLYFFWLLFATSPCNKCEHICWILHRYH